MCPICGGNRLTAVLFPAATLHLHSECACTNMYTRPGLACNRGQPFQGSSVTSDNAKKGFGMIGGKEENVTFQIVSRC